MEEKDLQLIEKRLDKLETVYEAINKLTLSIEKLAIETKYLREDQNSLANRVENLERKPEKRYDTVVTTIITTIVGAIIGAIMALVIKK